MVQDTEPIPGGSREKESVMANDSKVVINLATGLEDGATVFRY